MPRCVRLTFIFCLSIFYSGCYKVSEDPEARESREYWEDAYDKNWQQIENDDVSSPSKQNESDNGGDSDTDTDSDSDFDSDSDMDYWQDEPSDTDYDPGFGLGKNEICAVAATIPIGQCRPEKSGCIAGEGNDFDRLIAVHFPSLTQFRGNGYNIDSCQKGLKCCIYGSVCSDINSLLFKTQLMGDPAGFVADPDVVGIGCQINQCAGDVPYVNPVGCGDLQYCCPKYRLPDLVK